MNKMITLSIIMPIYNTALYLPECLKSILKIKNITYEIICINDGSTDNSFNVLIQYKKYFKNIKIISLQNSGAYYTRNLGLDLAEGKYIQFIDSDDTINAEYINSVISFLDDNNLDMLSIYGKVDKDGILSYNKKFEHPYIPESFKNIPLESYKIKNYFYAFQGYTWLHIYNRSFLKSINNRFFIESHFADYFFFQKAIIQSKKYAIITTHLYNYRQRSGQLTSNNNSRYFSYLNVHKKVFDLYFSYYGREYALKYLNYYTQFFNKHSQWIEDKYKDEYKYALSHFYDYCLNKND